MLDRRRVALALGASPWAVVLVGCTGTSIAFGPASISGGLLRLGSAQGERLVFITSQWESRYLYTGSSTSRTRRGAQFLHIDLWQFDVATAQPVQRLRLATSKQLGDVAALGVDRGVLWARLPGLIGVRLADGAVVADRARVAAANPDIADMLPQPPAGPVFMTQQQQPLRFTPAEGLVVRLDDGRRVRLDPLTLKALPLAAAATDDKPAPAADPQRQLPHRLAQGNQWNAMVRGLPIGSTAARRLEWLGLVAEREVEPIGRTGQTTSVPDFTQPDRFRLYRGQLLPQQHLFGLRHRLKLVAPLPEAPEFLFAGLGVENPEAHPAVALWRRAPDSVFVLHRDRLGEQGRWVLSRVAGPDGRVVWRAELPLSDLSLWWPGERHAVLAGRWAAAVRAPEAQPNEGASPQIVSVNLETGALAVFNLDAQRGWPATSVVSA